MAAPGNSLQEQSQEHKLVVVCRRPFESVLTVCVWASWSRLLCWILQRENGNSTCTLDSWSCNSSLRLSLRGCKSHKFAVLDVDLSLFWLNRDASLVDYNIFCMNSSCSPSVQYMSRF